MDPSILIPSGILTSNNNNFLQQAEVDMLMINSSWGSSLEYDFFFNSVEIFFFKNGKQIEFERAKSIVYFQVIERLKRKIKKY